MAIPLILQFIIGLSTAVVFNVNLPISILTSPYLHIPLTQIQTIGTLLTDVHPKSPSTASAANSIVRCLLAGGGLALVQVFIDSIGVQWTFTLFGGVCLGCLGLVWLEWRYGRFWRDTMRERNVER
jgi:hypothetical protein